MTDRIDLRKAIDLLPRYNTPRGTWRHDGSRCTTNNKVLPDRFEKPFRKLVHNMFQWRYKPTVEWMDVCAEDMWVLHASLRVASLDWLIKKNWSWQHWRDLEKLPIYMRYKGKVIVWNGTHRMTLGALASKKIRARVYDVDEFVKWRAAKLKER